MKICFKTQKIFPCGNQRKKTDSIKYIKISKIIYNLLNPIKLKAKIPQHRYLRALVWGLTKLSSTALVRFTLSV